MWVDAKDLWIQRPILSLAIFVLWVRCTRRWALTTCTWKKRNRAPGLSCISFLRLEKMPRDLARSFSQPACSTWPLSVARKAAARQQGEIRLEKCACRGSGEGGAQGANHFHSAAAAPAAAGPLLQPEGQYSKQAGNRTVSRKGKKETCSFSDRSLFPPWSTASKGSCLSGRVFDQIRFACLR